MAETARILIVEDDPHLAVILALNLGAADLDVRVVADGLEALEVFDAWRPMLVILDLGIPTISGFRLIAVFKRLAPTVPVIVATALDFEEAVEVARSGADDFLTKPFDPALLLKKVGFHLGRRMPTPDGDGRVDRRPTPVSARPRGMVSPPSCSSGAACGRSAAPTGVASASAGSRRTSSADGTRSRQVAVNRGRPPPTDRRCARPVNAPCTGGAYPALRRGEESWHEPARISIRSAR